MKEVWQPLKAWPYAVSSRGRIKRTGRAGGAVVGRILRPGRSGNGYLVVTLYAGARQKATSVHRLVAETFLGVPGEGVECNHRDGDKRNNAAENLEWVTRPQNVRHCIENGLRQRSSLAKLSADDVRSIRARVKAGEAQRKIAAEYGITQNRVSLIKRNLIYRGVSA